MKKYKLRTDLTIKHARKTLFRVEAIINFGTVKKGELGGYVEKQDNLSQAGDAWVTGNAMVTGNALVAGNALITGNAEVTGDARVTDNALVKGDARVTGNARVKGNALVTDNALVTGNALVTSDALVTGDAEVTGNALVTSNALVTGNALITGNAEVTGDAEITGNAEISKPHHLMFISGFKFGVTVLHCQVQVGCRLIMLDEIDSIKYEDIKFEGVSEFEFEALRVMINVALEYILTKISEE